MGVTDRDRLSRLLGGDDLRWLLDRVRRRLERGESLDTSVILTGATPGQRAAVQGLLGRRPGTGETLTVSLPAVDAVLRRSGACPDGLAVAVVTLTGEVPDRATATAALDRAWRAAFAPLDAVVAGRPELGDWLERVTRSGLVRKLAKTPQAATPLLSELAAVIGGLPANGELLGHFAARVVKRSHALDHDQPLTTLTLSAARAISGFADGSGAQWRRELWASVGLLKDDLSTTVLTLGFRGDDTPTGRALAAWHAAGEPVVLTLRQLVRDRVRPRAGEVFVCENPVVVSAAAERLGAGCAPLVCTAGQPGAAAMHLLRTLADGGAAMRYHGDFDWGGVRIGNVVFGRLPATPWRFGATDYRAAAERGHVLRGLPATAVWDDALSDEMRRTGRAVEEEHVIDALIADLAR
jgi:uncharacterized protein (TIGR02679 family)